MTSMTILDKSRLLPRQQKIVAFNDVFELKGLRNIKVLARDNSRQFEKLLAAIQILTCNFEAQMSQIGSFSLKYQIAIPSVHLMLLEAILP